MVRVREVMDAKDEGGRVLRKRRKVEAAQVDGLSRLLDLASAASKIVVFSGSGLSAQSGTSTELVMSNFYRACLSSFHSLYRGQFLWLWVVSLIRYLHWKRQPGNVIGLSRVFGLTP